MQAIVKRVEGLTFVGKADTNHWVVMDGHKESGGADAGASPKELVLIALGACSAFDVEGILKKRCLEVRSLEVELDADVAAEHPKVFTEVRLTYRIEGSVPTPEIERAVRLSQEKYCSVSAMLRHACPIRWRALVNGEELASGAEGLPEEHRAGSA
jgi:putative redox protein